MVSRRSQSKRRGQKTNRRRSLKGGFLCGPACVPVVLGGLVTAYKSMNSEIVSRKGFEYTGKKSHKNGKTSKSKVRIELVKGKGKKRNGKKSKGKGTSKSKGKGKGKKTKKATSETWVLKKNNVVRKTFHNKERGYAEYKKLIKTCESKGYDKC